MSATVEAPTVMAEAARAGDVFPALVLELPAATTTWTPAAVREAIALSRAVDAEPPRDMETTEGRREFLAWAATQLRPEMLRIILQRTPFELVSRGTHMPEVAPEPVDERT